jgi:hypothetical protein
LKILPKEFVQFHNQTLVTTVSDPDLSTVSSIAENVSFPSSIQRAPYPSYQQSVIRRVFIYDSSFLDILNNDPDFMNNEKGVASVFSMGQELSKETVNNFDETIDCQSFNTKLFLSGSDSLSATVFGFKLSQHKNCNVCFDNSSSNVSPCERTGDYNDTVHGHLVTFSNASLFKAKFNQLQKHLEERGSSGSRLWATVPVLGNIASKTGNGLEKIPSTNFENADSMIVPPSETEEHLYLALLCYQEMTAES